METAILVAKSVSKTLLHRPIFLDLFSYERIIAWEPRISV